MTTLFEFGLIFASAMDYTYFKKNLSYRDLVRMEEKLECYQF